MLSSIHPLGEQGRGFNFRGTASAFVLGSVLGGLFTGLVVGAVGTAIGWLITAAYTNPTISVRLLLIGLAAVAGMWFEFGGRTIPSLSRQVNEDWLNEYRNWVYGFGFGFQLGGGVWTFITSAAVVVWLVSMLVAPSLIASLVVGASFGLARGLGILSVRRVRSSSELVEFHRRLHRSSPLVQRLGLICLGGLAVLAGASGTMNGVL